VGLEATVAPLAGSVDELEVDLLHVATTERGQQRLHTHTRNIRLNAMNNFFFLSFVQNGQNALFPFPDGKTSTSLPYYFPLFHKD
jgi:hypothetical protein